MINYDSRGVKPSQFSDLLPAGQYVLQITNTEEKKTAKGQPMVKVTCSVESPAEFAGATVFHNVTFIEKGQPGAGIAIHFLKTIGQPFEESEGLEINPKDWAFSKARFKAAIIQELYTKPDMTVVTTNKIKSVMPAPAEVDF